VQGGGGKGRGIAQWEVNGSRDLTFRARHSGIKIADASFSQQLELVDHELHNPVLSKDRTLTDKKYLNAGNELRKATTLSSAVAIVLKAYEIAGAARQNAERASIAKAMFDYWVKVPGVFQPSGK
jgi:Phage tail lysozyme